MKIDIKRDELLAALDRVKHTIAITKMVQMLQCFCFRNGYIDTFNGSAGTRATFNLDGMEFAIPADKFYRLVAAMREDISLSLGATGILTVKSGSNRTTISTIPVKGFPWQPPKETREFCTAPDFISALEKVIPTVGTDQKRLALCGVGIQDDYLYSTDGKRISVAKIEVPATGSFSITEPSANHLIKLGQPDSIERTDSTLLAKYDGGNTLYASVGIAENFPYSSVLKLMDETAGDEIASFPSDIIDAIDRMQIMLSGDESTIIIENTDAGLEFRSAGEGCDAFEFLAWDYKKYFRFAVRPDWLKKCIQTSTKVDLTNVVNGGGGKLLFTDDSGYRSILALMALPDA